MRHRKSGRKLKRTASHRRSTLAALSTSLLRHKRITTTVAKAKETRNVVEKMITRARKAMANKEAVAQGVHARREIGRMIKDRTVIGELFSTIVEKIGDRPGGYTRIVKLGQRLGDGAEMAIIELVDFNTGQEAVEKKADKKEEKKAKPKSSKKKTDEETGDTKAKAAGEKTGEAEKKPTARKPRTKKKS